jgi:TonB-linked SusC/RagA family outer membrane protein
MFVASLAERLKNVCKTSYSPQTKIMILTAGYQNESEIKSLVAKTWIIMKITAVLLIFTLHVNAKSDAQRVTIVSHNIYLPQVFKDIERQTGYLFFFDKDAIQKTEPIDISVKEATLEQALSACLKGQQFAYTIVKSTIVIRPIKLLTMQRSTALVISAPLPIEIHGRVTDENGNPLSNANVIIKGTKKGVITNGNGEFSIEVPNNRAMLVISFTGYQNKEITVGGQTSVVISLVHTDNALNAVVVTALGIKRNVRSLTSSSQTVNVEQLKKISDPNIMNSLVGKVAGLEILSGAMDIGGADRVVIRGNRSISGDSQPLYIIDGVPILGDPSNLEASNIASINVLKGPSAAALYGSEAQNGVVVITTKNGTAGHNTMSFNTNISLSTPVVSYPFQNQYGQGNSGVYDAGSDLSWGPKMEGQMVQNWSLDPKDKGTQYALTPQPDNIRDFYRTGKLWTNSLDITRGGQNVQAAFSYTNTYGEGVTPNNSLNRNNLSLRVGSDLLDENGKGPLKLDSKLSFTQERRKGAVMPGFNGSAEGLWTIPRSIRESQMRNYEFTDSTGAIRQNYWVPQSIWDQNPYWRSYRDVVSSTLNRITGFLSLKYDFTTDLDLQVRGSYDGENTTGDLKDFNDTYNTAQFGLYAVNESDSYLLNGDFLLSYKKAYNKWNINGNIGGSVRQAESNANSVNTGQALVIPDFFALSNTLLPVIGAQTKLNEVTQSLYAFGQFSFKNDIFLDVSGRNDWSSTLPINNLSYFYPSLGLSAIISDLIPAFPKWISFTKIEASGSQVGSGAQPYMLDRTAFFTPGGNNGFITLNSILPAGNLKPEISKSYEAGLIMRFFHDRFGFELTAYKTNTFNQLFTLGLPIGSGATSFYTNGGNVQNKGIEAILNATVMHTRNFRWSFDVNFSANRSMVLKINDQRPKVQVGDITIEQGQPFGNIYQRGFLRDSLGSVIVGSNGIPEATTGNTVKIANFNPDWLGSISSTFSYKNVSLSISIDHRQGGTMFSNINARLYGDGQAKATLQGREGGLIFGNNFFSNEKAVLENGQKNNVPITAQQFWQSMGGRNDVVGELFSVSATNTRLRSLSITYSLSLVKYDMPVSGMDFSLVGTNLFFIQRASKTVDPDLMANTGPGSIGISDFTLPTMRTFGVNVKVNFK